MVLVDDLLGRRGVTHGDYGDVARIVQNWKRALRTSSCFSLNSPVCQESADMILTKLGRIISGDWRCLDHWDDIRGYALLAANSIHDEPHDRGAFGQYTMRIGFVKAATTDPLWLSKSVELQAVLLRLLVELTRAMSSGGGRAAWHEFSNVTERSYATLIDGD